MTDFFNPDDSWSQKVVNVAGKSGLSAVEGTVEYCGATPRTLELRLADNFRTLKFNVGQANTSPSSDQVMVVTLSGNGRQIEAKRVPFNKIQPFSSSVVGVNALTISFELDQSVDKCNSAEIQAALFDAVLN